MLLQGSKGLDQPVWRDGRTRGGQGGGEQDGQDINIIVLWLHWEDCHLIFKTAVASHGTKGKRNTVVQMIEVMVMSDPWMCIRTGFCLCSRPQRSAIAWVVGRIMMVSTAVKEKNNVHLSYGSRTSGSLWTETSVDTDRVKRGQGKLTFLPRPNLTSR